MLSHKLDHQFKIVTIGDYGVGKSSLIRHYVDHVFHPNHIGPCADIYRHNSLVGDQIVQLQIWDTAGQERYCPLGHQYYRQADGILIVYDIGNRESFDHVNLWLAEIEKFRTSTVIKILIGNKIDGQREVPFSEAHSFATANDLLFFETSAKSAIDVENVFSTMAQQLTQKLHHPSVGLMGSVSRTHYRCC